MNTERNEQPDSPESNGLGGRVAPEPPVARLSITPTEEVSAEAIKILVDAGFKVVMSPVSGLFEPQLILDMDPIFRIYRGLDEIREVAGRLRK